VELEEKIAHLEGAGFEIGYVVPEDVEYGRVIAFDINVNSGWDTIAYVSFESVARGTDSLDQTSTVHRSNYRRLRAVYPNVWTDTAFSNCRALGAFVRDLPENVVGIMCGLATDYPVYDEEDMSALESDEIYDSYDQYAERDMVRELPDDVRDMWDELGWEYATDGTATAFHPTVARDLFWQAVEATESYPEHNGLDVLWRYEKIAEHITTYLRTIAA
jgi:hypothetical protein